MAAETEVPEDISVLSEVRVDENYQVETRSCTDLPKVDEDCGRTASEAVSVCNGEAETGKNGNSMGEDDPDGSYVFISRSNSVNGDSIEKTLLEGDPVSVAGSLMHDNEIQVQKLSADDGEAAPQEANESHLLDNVEPVVLAVKPVTDGSPSALANGAQEEHKGGDLESIQQVSASQGGEGTPILILSAGDHQPYNDLAKIGVVGQESIPESDETCLDSNLREAPESGVCGSDVGKSHVQESEEIKGVSLGSTEYTPPLREDVKIQYSEENKIGSEPETEKIHFEPLLDGIKINVDMDGHKGVDHESIQLESTSEEDHRSPIFILNDGDPSIDNVVAKVGVTSQESTPELDVTCLVTKPGEVLESGVLGSDVGSIKEEKNNSESCHGQESEEIEEGVSLGSTESTPPFIDDMKIQYEEERKIGSETETEKTQSAPLIEYLKVNGDQEEHIGADHEPIQSETNGRYPLLTLNAVDPELHNGVAKIGVTDSIKVNGSLEEHSGVDCKPIQSEDDGSSPILVSNVVDPKLHNGVDELRVTDQECTPELDETFVPYNLVEATDSGVIVSDIDNIENKTNLESTCHGQESEERKEVISVSTECTPPVVDDNKIQYEEETNTGSYTKTEKFQAALLIVDGEVDSDKEVITESDSKIEMSNESQSIQSEATGGKQQQVEDENKAIPPMLMKEALTSEIITPQFSDEARQFEYGEENLEESGKIDDSQSLQESGLEVDLSKEVAKVTTEAGIPAVEVTSSKSLNEDVKFVCYNDEIYNVGAELPNPLTDAFLEDKNVRLDDCLLVKPVFTSPDPALSSSNEKNESGMLNEVKVPLSPEPDPQNREDLGSQSTDSPENGDEACRKLECEIENSATSNNAPVCELKDVDTDEKKSDVEDEAVDIGENTANCMPEVSDIQNEERIDRDITLPTTAEDAESKSNAPEEQSVGFGLVKRPFNYLIKMPRYENDTLRKQIDRAQQEVEEKTKNRDVTKSEIKDRKTKSQELQGIFESARSDERSARGLVKSKRQEIDAVQTIINKVKNAITVDDIDARIRGMEHMIQHETVPLREEKQYIREINQLMHLREQLCSSMGSQDEVQQALDQKDEAEERLKILKKELDRLKDTVSKTEEAARVAWKKLDEEKNKIRELYIQFTTEDDVRQDTFRHLQNLKKQLRDKNVLFRRYKDEEECANGYAASGDKEVLHLFCANQVSKIMKQWNEDDEFRKEYIKCNERSTVRRFGTRDGRALGPDEQPPPLPKTWDRRAVSVAKPMKVNTEKLAVIENDETNGKPAEKEVVVQIEQKLKSEIPAKPPNSDKTPETKEKSGGIEDVKEESGGTEDVKEEKPEKTNEEIELERKAEELREEEEMVKMKELWKLEEKVKEKEALERKKKNAEKATVRAEVRKQKEKEQRDKEREKKLRKKERKKVSGTEEEGSREVESSQAGFVASQNIALAKEAEITVIKESNIIPPTTITKKAAAIQYVKHSKSKLVPPPALRNKGKRRMQQWIWAIGITALAIVLFLIGNIGFYSSLMERRSGL